MSEKKLDPEEDVPIKMSKEHVVIVDGMDSDEIPLGRRYGESVVKRIRISEGKVVSSEVKTPKTRTKNSGLGPKKG